MRFYNTLTRDVDEFKEMNSGRINMFVCGPTVQDHFHIGHARTYIFFDAVAKLLRNLGYSVFYLQNITDIDDKIINKAREMNIQPQDVADMYLREFLEDMSALKVTSVNYFAKSTLYINEIISQISRLIEKGYAYETSDGVYFEVSKFADYGQLSNQSLDQIIHGYRVAVNENKRNPEDFVLWKKRKPGEPYWDSPWGPGRPGWHIEDTAITETYFGPEYDIHGGGSDLIFPHHEAEIAQMRAISGRKYLSHYWIHTGMINVNNEKMSKSLKNFVTIREVLKEYRPEDLRYALLNANYRTQLDFSKGLLEESRKQVEYLNSTFRKLVNASGNSDLSADPSAVIKRMVDEATNDFDFRSVFRDLIDFAGDLNKNIESISRPAAQKAIDVFRWVDSFAGILLPETARLSGIIDDLLDLRKNLRTERKFQEADRIRDLLLKNGIHVEDRGDETIWW
ncbi:probable cysteinyl-tRNA synthetase [Thermoplasma acidophilum]|uniref:Cysteine--tRNA ligase n=1 Tax=Thermoplasma acidophilum (strain ATCC 25905 / DSM 1728 / JCM 9062 / NBRC 15155 / AMRC-C165) TaxID=273075 RepID=SYC_THEAC|nr:cysteine--tRNA ligase [Thermoplasma acidophilum]Q9HJ27.1 RecName: Full=Cysteine--tRNA ligase; AltName: Full=Cysteinyl-tRNA synthetase; Short=CysRS [Thermoplasma acidophilum DSM 1728]MCY0851879.1 cysteine--tRNA ligase [Thermoplasma acidophilum]CAC12272.1 probable cysteinyl-tRNA synthetase [Thermoplasma acidophilum]